MSPLQYRDLTDVADVPGLGMIICNSRGVPPTKITWKRDNVVLSVGGSSSYQQIQNVVSRASSAYSNVLMLMDPNEVISNSTYTCTVSNQMGSVSREIKVTTTGICFYC